MKLPERGQLSVGTELLVENRRQIEALQIVDLHSLIQLNPANLESDPPVPLPDKSRFQPMLDGNAGFGRIPGR